MKFFTKRGLKEYNELFLGSAKAKMEIAELDYKGKCLEMEAKEIYLNFFENMLGIKLDGSISIEELSRMFKEKTEFDKLFKEKFYSSYQAGIEIGVKSVIDVCLNNNIINRETAQRWHDAAVRGAADAIKQRKLEDEDKSSVHN
jgi:hypothetical protein